MHSSIRGSNSGSVSLFPSKKKKKENKPYTNLVLLANLMRWLMELKGVQNQLPGLHDYQGSSHSKFHSEIYDT